MTLDYANNKMTLSSIYFIAIPFHTYYNYSYDEDRKGSGVDPKWSCVMFEIT